MSLYFCRRGILVGVVLTLVVCLGSSMAHAQYRPNYELSLQGGYDQTLSTLKNFAEDGFAGGASLGYRFSERLVLGGDVQLHSFHVNDAITDPFSNNIDISSTMLETGGFAKLYLNQRDQRLYVRGSGGIFYGRTKANYLGVESTGTSTDPGMSGAVGLELFGPRNSATYFEASYHRILGEDIHWMSFQMGASFFLW